MRAAFAFVAGCLLAVPARVRGRPPAADKVVLTVVVKDKKDLAVVDLKPEEVEVTENGSRRPVESVRFVRAGEAPEGVPSPGNLVSLVFSGMDVNQQKRAKQAVEELLKHDLGKGTEIAVFRIGLQLWTVQPFTSDLALVRPRRWRRRPATWTRPWPSPTPRPASRSRTHSPSSRRARPPTRRPSRGRRSWARSSARGTACSASSSWARRSTS